MEKLLKLLLEEKIEYNRNNSHQVGNYCYLIAGIEMLLGCKLFLQYLSVFKNFNNLLMLLYKYNEKKDFILLSAIEDYIINDFYYKGDRPRKGLQEDVNVLFICLQKVKFFKTLFSEFKYINMREPYIETAKLPPISIYAIINLNCTNGEIINKLKVPYIYSIAYRSGNHYEVMHNTDMGYVPKNTDWMRNSKCDILYVICLSFYNKQRSSGLIYNLLKL